MFPKIIKKTNILIFLLVTNVTCASFFPLQARFLSTPGSTEFRESFPQKLDIFQKPRSVILAFNCGSSSVKCKVYDEDHLAKAILDYNIERIGQDGSFKTHEEAIQFIFRELLQKNFIVKCIGHRVVMGGNEFVNSTLIDDTVIKKIEENSHLAPDHNPHNLTGILFCRELLPHVPQVAVFDTAFHQTIPEVARAFGLPYLLYKLFGIKKYGFHGTSFRFVARAAAEQLNKPLDSLNLIICHLGNGASIAALRNGKAIETTMGLTPLDGLVMGERSGGFDPSIILIILERGMYKDGQLILSPEPLVESERLSLKEVKRILHKESGLKGLSEISNDFRAVKKAADEGNKQAQFALDVFIYRIQHYISAYHGRLGKLDAIIFTGGIGQNSEWLRDKVINSNDLPLIKKLYQRKHLPVLNIATDEERLIAEDTQSIIQKEFDVESFETALPEIDAYKGISRNVMLTAPKKTWKNDVELQNLDAYAMKMAFSAVQSAAEFYYKYHTTPRIAFLSYHSTNLKDVLPEKFQNLATISLSQAFEARYKQQKRSPRISKLTLTSTSKNPEYEKAYVLIVEKAYRIVESMKNNLPFPITLVGKGGLQGDTALIPEIFEKKIYVKVDSDSFPPNIFVFPNLHTMEYCRDLLEIQNNRLAEISSYKKILDRIQKQLEQLDRDSLPVIIMPETINARTGSVSKPIIEAGIVVTQRKLAKVIFIGHKPNLIINTYKQITSLIQEGLIEIGRPQDILQNISTQKTFQRNILQSLPSFLQQILQRILSIKIKKDPYVMLTENLKAGSRLLSRLLKDDIHCALLAGAELNTGDIILQSAKFKSKIKDLYDYFLMFFPGTSVGKDGLILYANTANQECPDAEGIKEMALESMKKFTEITRETPRIALLTSDDRDLDKVEEAWKKLKKELRAQTATDIQTIIGEGPMTMKEALNGKYNIFIFPDLMSGNIAYKWSERILSAKALGPFILGTKVPFSDLSRGADKESIIATAIVLARMASHRDTQARIIERVSDEIPVSH